ncbi:hypothetical protein SAMN05444487_101145 [Marininema mesophilum]|uniref:Uncharacterized protein n=1 Tax=Marininema mesophilum TaxID=1048340 RepID=A0A1H2QA65_9BACL|nr:hypothetical protein [Marininema mesophilum]SDW03574.1 hypothetical protein SAMN05444487_101145 [Marininema mesophilum]
MRQCTPLDITPYINNRGITQANIDHHLGFISVGGCSFPLEEVPIETGLICEEIPFLFSRTDEGDNIELEGQTLSFAQVLAGQVHILGVSTNGNFFDRVQFFREGKLVRVSRLALTNFIEREPFFPQNRVALQFTHVNTRVGPKDTFKPILWHTSLDLEGEFSIDTICFEDNPSMHIFAITIESGGND